MLNISVIVNTLAIIAGSILGILFGKIIKEKYKKLVFIAIGLLTIGLGIDLFLDATEILIVLFSMIVGGIIGETIDIEKQLGKLTAKKGDANFVKGFVTSLVLFVVGPMTIIGSIQAGVANNNDLIFIKSLMDGISSIVFASTFGVGVVFSALGVYLIQGLLVTFASQLYFLQTEIYIGNLSAIGGLMMIALGLRLLEIKEIKVGNFLPALIIGPFLSFIFSLF
ncbi:MAG: uncharacterized protein PWQ77_1552 [Kosmotogales bacterium]|nr:uncharacterized protein [Kosmotogales bacterium]